MSLVTACAREPVIEYRTEYVYPPSPLLQPSLIPEYRGETWGELAEYCIDVLSQLRQCEADKRGTREWVEGHAASKN